MVYHVKKCGFILWWVIGKAYDQGHPLGVASKEHGRQLWDWEDWRQRGHLGGGHPTQTWAKRTEEEMKISQIFRSWNNQDYDSLNVGVEGQGWLDSVSLISGSGNVGSID